MLAYFTWTCMIKVTFSLPHIGEWSDLSNGIMGIHSMHIIPEYLGHLTEAS